MRESRKLHSVYSDKPLDADEVIRLECAAELRREERTREFARGASGSHGSLEAFIDSLESSDPFNCEHVVPQSWFNKKAPMRGDLHHLFTCEPDCNSFRGNTPYFQFSQEVERVDCGRREGDKFEPKANKGAVARATFYFLLRYPGVIGNVESELQPDRLKMLVDWHNEFPPVLWEQHRNAEIFAVQGNRNPFIDYPEWISRVDLKLGFGG